MDRPRTRSKADCRSVVTMCGCPSRCSCRGPCRDAAHRDERTSAVKRPASSLAIRSSETTKSSQPSLALERSRGFIWAATAAYSSAGSAKQQPRDRRARTFATASRRRCRPRRRYCPKRRAPRRWRRRCWYRAGRRRARLHAVHDVADGELRVLVIDDDRAAVAAPVAGARAERHLGRLLRP